MSVAYPLTRCLFNSSFVKPTHLCSILVRRVVLMVNKFGETLCTLMCQCSFVYIYVALVKLAPVWAASRKFMHLESHKMNVFSMLSSVCERWKDWRPHVFGSSGNPGWNILTIVISSVKLMIHFIKTNDPLRTVLFWGGTHYTCIFCHFMKDTMLCSLLKSFLSNTLNHV